MIKEKNIRMDDVKYRTHLFNVLSIQPWKWSEHPGVMTAPLVCIFGCRDPVTAVAYFPNGCTCHNNKFQPRCYHHMMRAYDSLEEFVIVEDFIVEEEKMRWLSPDEVRELVKPFRCEECGASVNFHLRGCKNAKPE